MYCTPYIRAAKGSAQPSLWLYFFSQNVIVTMHIHLFCPTPRLNKQIHVATIKFWKKVVKPIYLYFKTGMSFVTSCSVNCPIWSYI